MRLFPIQMKNRVNYVDKAGNHYRKDDGKMIINGKSYSMEEGKRRMRDLQVGDVKEK